jgi:hypothetical protein
VRFVGVRLIRRLILRRGCRVAHDSI